MKTILPLLFSIVLLASPLHEAVKKVDLKEVKRLIKSGADINALDEKGRTPLHIAASTGRLSLVKYLVQNSADIHLKDKFHKTALIYAIKNNNIKVIVLLSKKISTTSVKKETNNLFGAAKDGNISAVIYFINNQDINSIDEDGKTALHIASEEGKTNVVELLIELEIDKNILDYDGRTALNYAKLSGNKEIIKLLTQDNNETK